MHRDVNLIVIHCSASADGKPLLHGDSAHLPIRTAAEVIDGWHKARGFTRTMAWRLALNRELEAIGYHWVIDVGGAIQSGRHMDEAGAHVTGHNAHSIGICVVGTERFTPAQWKSLKDLVRSMRLKFLDAAVCGHRDLSPDRNGDGVIEPAEWTKTCPGFSVASWLAAGCVPRQENIFNPPKEAHA